MSRHPGSPATYVDKHRERTDPPGQWIRSEPFLDLEAANAFFQVLALEHPELEETRIEATKERVACS